MPLFWEFTNLFIIIPENNGQVSYDINITLLHFYATVMRIDQL